MITLSATGKKPGRYHEELIQDSYHQERGQAMLVPGGKLGQGLIPLGDITPQVLNNIFAGYNPEKTKKLVHQAGAKRAQGLDAVLAVPKWVSALFALLPAPLRETLLAWVLAAAEVTMSVAEKELALTRRGAGGRRVEHAVGIAWIFAAHPASRAGAPHLHVHVLIPNVCQRADGTTGTLILEEFFLNRRLLTTIFHEELARRVGLGFGLKLKPAKIGYELVLPESVAARFKGLCRRWSPGRRAIEEHLTRRGLRGGRAAELAQKKLRPGKTVERYEDLLLRWRAEAKERGIALDDLMPHWREMFPERTAPDRPLTPKNQPTTPAQRPAAEPPEPVHGIARQERAPSAAAQASPLPPPSFVDPAPAPLPDPEELEHLLDALAKDLTRTKNLFSERQVLRRVTQLAAQTGFPTAGFVHAALTFLRDSDSIIRLGRNRSGVPFFTTRARYLEEKRLLDLAAAAAEKVAKPFSTRQLETAIARSERETGKLFDPQERAALQALATGSALWSLLDARLGERTEQALDVLRRTALAEGLQVLGVAATAQDAASLAERINIPSQSVHRWLLDYNRRTFEPPRDRLRELIEALIGKRTAFDRAVGNLLQRGVQLAAERVFGPPGALRLTSQSLVVVSGAQKLAVRDLADFLELVQLSGARALIVGHESGLPSILHQGSFAALRDLLAPQPALPHKTDAEVPSLQRAQQLFGARASEAALRELATQGRLSISESKEDALHKLVADWKAYGAKNPRQNVILTSSREAAHQANLLAQSARRKALRIAPFHWLKVGDFKIRQEDRVVFRHGLKLPGGLFPRRVRSGEHGRVVSVDIWKRRIQVKTDKGLLVTFDPKKYQPIELAYARTIQRGEALQGQRSFVLIEGESFQTLTAKLRTGIHDLRLYTTGLDAGEALERLVAQAQRIDGQPLASSFERILTPEEQPRRHQPLLPPLKRGY